MTALQDWIVQTVMVIAVAAVATACTNNVPPCEQGDDDGGTNCTPCTHDSDCGGASQPGEVCAPDMSCWPPNDLRTVTLNWTVGGQPASATTCMGLPRDFNFEFVTSDPLSVDSITTPSLPCADGTVVTKQVGDGLTTILSEDLLDPLGAEPLQTACPPYQTTCVIDIPCVDDIAGEVCSIVGTYLPASEVETVKVTWTVNGQPASASSCNAIDFVNPLTVELTDPNGSDFYQDVDVQCAAGAFSASKVPTSLQTVFISYPGELVGSATLANGSATLNLTVP